MYRVITVLSMQIIDLTKGKYSASTAPYLTDKLDEYVVSALCRREFFNKNFLFNRYCCHLGTMAQKLRQFLQCVPVFLVDTSMSQRDICMPGKNIPVEIPSDSYELERITDKNDDFPFRKFKDKPEDNAKCEENDTKDSKQLVITDFLGVYISDQNCLMPSRIFVWMDKICNAAQQDKENSMALLEQVILHEYSHALLDVTLYGFIHTNYFNHLSYPYKYLEESLANGISLLCGFEHWSSSQQKFIESFVRKQPKEYAAGWSLFQKRDISDVAAFWLKAKAQLDKEKIDVLELFWGHKDFHYLSARSKDFSFFINGIMLVDWCGDETWTYKENNSELLGLMNIVNEPVVVCNPKYNSFWSPDENGLRMVRLDSTAGYKYGYIDKDGNEQIPVQYDYIYSFENGLTVAKLNDSYGIINEHNEIMVPFELKYPDMRALRNGYATMKDESGKWGTINAKGEVVIPCQYDSLVVFDKKGVASVDMDGEKFFIDTKGNRI